MASGHRLTRAMLLVLLAAGCGRAPLEGRYQRGLAWIEFRADGTVVHGELGDRARVEFDDKDTSALVLVSGDMRTTGRILDPSTVEFTPGASSLATAFAGRWVAGAPATTPRLAAEESQRFAAPLLGGWGEPGQPAFLEFRSDATFSRGKGIGGTYEMLAADRVRLVLIQNGTPAGQLDHAVRIEGENLTLTAPDGAVTSYQRVR
jgi:hypothetical protein